MRRRDSKKQTWTVKAFWLLYLHDRKFFLFWWFMGSWAYRTTVLAISRLVSDRRTGKTLLIVVSNYHQHALQQGNHYPNPGIEFPHHTTWSQQDERDGYALSTGWERNPKISISLLLGAYIYVPKQTPLTGKRRGGRTKLHHPTSWNNYKKIFCTAYLAVHRVKQSPIAS